MKGPMHSPVDRLVALSPSLLGSFFSAVATKSVLFPQIDDLLAHVQSVGYCSRRYGFSLLNYHATF
jgi:hypothetical protein